MNLRLYPEYKIFQPKTHACDSMLCLLKSIRNDIGCAHIHYHCLLTDKRSKQPLDHISQIPDDGLGFIFIATYSIHWALQYLFCDFNKSDPLFKEAFEFDSPVLWETLKNDNPRSRVLFECLKKYNIGDDGICVPLKDFTSRPAVVSFSFKNGDNPHRFSDKGFLTDCRLACETLHEAALTANAAFPKPSEVAVSPYEINCLTLLVSGWSDHLMSSALAVSTEDLNTLLDGLLAKLHADNRAHLAAKAVAAGLVTPRL